MSRFQDDTQRSAQRSTNPANAAQTGTAGAGLAVGDFVLIGICFFLVVAIIGAAFLVIGELTGKAAPNINLSIFFIILIYILCVGAGWLWGRYQSQTLAHKENSRLKEENFGLKNAVERLESERFSLQAQLRSTQSAPGAATPARTSQGSPAGLVPAVASKQPPPNIYESAREPKTRVICRNIRTRESFPREMREIACVSVGASSERAVVVLVTPTKGNTARTISMSESTARKGSSQILR